MNAPSTGKTISGNTSVILLRLCWAEVCDRINSTYDTDSRQNNSKQWRYCPESANALDFTAYGRISLNVGLALMMLPFVTGLLTAYFIVTALAQKNFCRSSERHKKHSLEKSLYRIRYLACHCCPLFCYRHAISPLTMCFSFPDVAVFRLCCLSRCYLFRYKQPSKNYSYRGYLGQPLVHGPKTVGW